MKFFLLFANRILRFSVMTFLACSFVLPAFANAASLVCSGKITTLAIHQPGTVVVMLSGMNEVVTVCRLDGDWVISGALAAPTGADACKALYATMLAGRHAGKSFVMYLDGDKVPTSCTTFTAWADVNLRFLSHAD